MTRAAKGGEMKLGRWGTSGLPVKANPELTIRSGGGVLPMKHSTLPPSPLTANCTASLEMIGGPTGRKTQSGQSDLKPAVLAGQVPPS